MKQLIETSQLEVYIKQSLQAGSLQISLSDSVINYLTGTLTEFIRSEALFKKYRYGLIEQENSLEPLTMLARTDSQEGLALRKLKAQIVGNECLFLVSFFYEYLLRQCGEALLKFHGQLGAVAYQYRAQFSEALVFLELADKFWNISGVVRNLDQSRIFQNKLVGAHQKYLIDGLGLDN